MTDSSIARRRAAARADGGAAYTQRRDEIVRTAARLFKEHGREAVRLGDIAKAMGADRASLYYYYSNRDEIFREIVRDALDVNVRRAEEIQASDATAPEKIRSLSTQLMRSYAENYPFLYVFIQEDLSRLPEESDWAGEIKRLSRRYDDAIVGIVQQGLDEGTLSSRAPARVVAFGLLGMINWTHRWFRPDDPRYDAQEIGETFADIAIRGLLTDGVSDTQATDADVSDRLDVSGTEARASR